MNSGRKTHCFFSIASSVSAFWTSTQSNLWHSLPAKMKIIPALVHVPGDRFSVKSMFACYELNLAQRKLHAIASKGWLRENTRKKYSVNLHTVVMRRTFIPLLQRKASAFPCQVLLEDFGSSVKRYIPYYSADTLIAASLSHDVIISSARCCMSLPTSQCGGQFHYTSGLWQETGNRNSQILCCGCLFFWGAGMLFYFLNLSFG